MLTPDIAVAKHAESGETMKSFITGLPPFDPRRPPGPDALILPESPLRSDVTPRGNGT